MSEPIEKNVNQDREMKQGMIIKKIEQTVEHRKYETMTADKYMLEVIAREDLWPAVDQIRITDRWIVDWGGYVHKTLTISFDTQGGFAEIHIKQMRFNVSHTGVDYDVKLKISSSHEGDPLRPIYNFINSLNEVNENNLADKINEFLKDFNEYMMPVLSQLICQVVCDYDICGQN